MLNKINEGCVVSDEGFKVKLGKHHVSYIETDGHTITFELEDTLTPYCLVVYFSSKEPTWHRPYNLEKLSTDDLKIIKTRIISVLQFLNIKYEIV